jgi:hypothetical protein
LLYDDPEGGAMNIAISLKDTDMNAAVDLQFGCARAPFWLIAAMISGAASLTRT